MGRAHNIVRDPFASVLGTRHGVSYEGTVEAEHPNAAAVRAGKAVCDRVRAGELDDALALLAENRRHMQLRPLLVEVRQAVIRYLCCADLDWSGWVGDLGEVVRALRLPLGGDPEMLPSEYASLAAESTRSAVEAWLDEMLAAANLDSVYLVESALVLRRREHVYAAADIMAAHGEAILRQVLGENHWDNSHDDGLYQHLRSQKGGGELAAHLTQEDWRRSFSDVAAMWREHKFQDAFVGIAEKKARERFASNLRERLRRNGTSAISLAAIGRVARTGVL